MIIICEIEITDSPSPMSGAEAATGAGVIDLVLNADAPDSLRCHAICPNAAGDHLVILCEAETLESVQEFLDFRLGQSGGRSGGQSAGQSGGQSASGVTGQAKCFVVDQASAMGLDALINKHGTNSQAELPAETEALAQLKKEFGPTTSPQAYQDLVAETQGQDAPTDSEAQAKHRRKRPKLAIFLCAVISSLSLWLLTTELIQYTKGGQAARVWLMDGRLPITPEVVDIYEVQLRPKWSFRLANLYSKRGEYSYQLQVDGKAVAVYRVGLERKKQGENVFLIEARDAIRDQPMPIPPGLMEE
jgi:hypothetical protein